MNRLLLIATLLLGLSPASRTTSAEQAQGAWLFTSFRGNGDGLHLAWSKDGYHWTDLGRTFLKPEVGGKLMRDPHIVRGPDGAFHMVWTTGWRDNGIGYASSTNLTDWSQQRFLPLMADIPGTGNCWAPESFYDETTEQFIVTWSSDVEGRFPETVSTNRMNNRTYYVTTKDFVTFSESKIFLDSGFDHIDTTIVKANGRFIAVFKEGDMQALGKHGPIHFATSDRALGPYVVNPTPIITERAEGPALVTIGDNTLLYADFYSAGHYGAFETTDWKTWKNVSAETSVVSGQRHGSILPVSEAELRVLAPDIERTPPPAVLPGVNADPHIAVFGDTFYIYPTTDGTEGWRSTSFSTWSSRDLVNWKNEGVILDLPRDLEWADIHAWAPAIATKNGKYYYYYSAQQNVGVAVADSPAGPFKDPLGKALVAKTDFPRMQAIDPMVYVDDDGSAYLYWGQGRCKAVKLNDDMISFDMADVRDITPPGYNEGPFVHKRNGTYYLSWSEFDTRDPRYSVAYATGNSPLGPFAKAAVNPILRQSGAVKGAGHHSIVKIPERDEWVIAYHRFRIPGGNGYNRETCLSPLRHAADGSILPVDVFETVGLAPAKQP
jgi:hypothetical protein